MLPSINILNGWKVLVVDDDPKSLDIAQTLLTHFGAETHTATNGAEGLHLATQIKPHFVISDLSMPVLDGWGMIEALKKERATAEIPIIALTAHAMPSDRERAIAAGCHNYLTKPLLPATFINDLITLLTDIPELAAQLNS